MKTYTYANSKHGQFLEPGDVIICNQSYGVILSVEPDFIVTSVGNRKFYPGHLYPVFTTSS